MSAAHLPPIDLLTAEAEGRFVPMLRDAGCQCPRPLLGWRPGIGPRCRLCNAIATGTPPMTPTRLRECLDALRWSQRGLADALNRPEGTVRQWARGAVQIPEDVAAWLEKAGRWHEKNPPPEREKPLA